MKPITVIQAAILLGLAVYGAAAQSEGRQPLPAPAPVLETSL